MRTNKLKLNFGKTEVLLGRSNLVLGSKWLNTDEISWVCTQSFPSVRSTFGCRDSSSGQEGIFQLQLVWKLRSFLDKKDLHGLVMSPPNSITVTTSSMWDCPWRWPRNCSWVQNATACVLRGTYKFPDVSCFERATLAPTSFLSPVQGAGCYLLCPIRDQGIWTIALHENSARLLRLSGEDLLHIPLPSDARRGGFLHDHTRALELPPCWSLPGSVDMSLPNAFEGWIIPVGFLCRGLLFSFSTVVIRTAVVLLLFLYN